MVGADLEVRRSYLAYLGRQDLLFMLVMVQHRRSKCQSRLRGGQWIMSCTYQEKLKDLSVA
jgi:hypothetical protein